MFNDPGVKKGGGPGSEACKKVSTAKLTYKIFIFKIGGGKLTGLKVVSSHFV